jgi:hypothetical protein
MQCLPCSRTAFEQARQSSHCPVTFDHVAGKYEFENVKRNYGGWQIQRSGIATDWS